MISYIVRRIFMMVPTLLGITLLTFLIINAAPGGPIDQKLQQMRFGGAMGSGGGASAVGGMRGGEMGVPQEVVDALKKQYGLDKPLHIRYFIWLKNLATLDFGKSFAAEEPVMDVVISKLPVSIQFGLASFILTYLVCIPLGVAKAVKDGTRFDALTSIQLLIFYSIPPLMMAVLLRTFLSNETFFDWFPVEGVVSKDYDEYTLWSQVLDRIHHFVLPLVCYMIGSFTVLTYLMKNSLIEEIKLDYVRTARAKGLNERAVIYKHALRNALIPIVTGLSGILSFFLAGSIIIEKFFNLDGMGLLFYSSALARDYNVMMALTFISAFVSLLGRLVSDLLYLIVDPRIDFS